MMILTYLAAALTLLTLPTQAAWNNGTWTPPSNCESAALVAAANATGFTSIAGIRVDDSTGKISSDSTLNWTVSASLSEDSRATQANLAFRLDTSATISTNATTLPYNPCIVFLVGAPQRGRGGDGCLSVKCTEALAKQYKSAAMMIVQQRRQNNPAYNDAEDVCSRMVTLTTPDECKDETGNAKSSSGDGSWGSTISTGRHYCSLPPPPPPPLLLFLHSVLYLGTTATLTSNRPKPPLTFPPSQPQIAPHPNPAYPSLSLPPSTMPTSPPISRPMTT